MSIPITLEGNSTDLTQTYHTPIMNLNKKYEICFRSFECDHSFANITEENNVFRYSTDSGATWKDLTIKTGMYEIDGLNKAVRKLMYENGDYDKTATTLNKQFYITLSINEATQCSIIFITNPQYRVDFSIPNSMREILGFDDQVLSRSYNESRGSIVISKITSILINTNLSEGGYFNNRKRSYIHAFLPDVDKGYKIREKNNDINDYRPVINSGITEFRVWLEDQDGNNLKFMFPTNTMSLRLQLREVNEKSST
jgi:hypothetical protein